MIAQNLHQLKVEKTALQTTSFAGLPLLTELAQHIGLVDQLDRIPNLWEREAGYSTSDYILGLAMTLIAGGEGLDDTRLLRNDAGLRQLSFPDFPAPNSFGRFLRRLDNRALYRLGEIVTRQGLHNIESGQTLTLDMDSTVVESDKEEAKFAYTGVRGYNPLLAWLAEPDVYLAGVFRDGNASPQSHALSLLKYCLTRLPAQARVRFRGDSAFYQVDVMGHCHRNNVEFTIAAKLNEAVREVIMGIPQKSWELVEEENQSYLLAETVYAPIGNYATVDMPAFRLVVKKYLTGQLDLFKDPIDYHAIVTNLPATWSALEVLRHYNKRGTAEKMIAELKNGFGLDRLPCATLKANAAFFQVCLLAYNLIQTFKRIALPKAWKMFCVKNLRFRLLCQAAIIVRHARRLILKLSEAFPFFEEFENARWAVLSPPAVT